MSLHCASPAARTPALPACASACRSALVLLIAAACLPLAGCTTVEAWERGRLARADMAITPEPEREWLHSHVQTSREAAQGDHGAGGGGCGCN